MPDLPSQNSSPETNGGAPYNGSPDGSPADAPKPATGGRLAAQLQQRPSLTQRSRRLGERAIEIGIFSIAALSIIFIFLIFFFIFREASPIFFGGEPAQTQAVVPETFDLPAGSDTSAEGKAAAAAEKQAAPSADTGDMISYNQVEDIPGQKSTSDSGASGSGAAGTSDSGTSGGPSTVAPGADTGDVIAYNQVDDIPRQAAGDSGTTGDTGKAPAAPATPLTAEQQKQARDSAARLIVGDDYPILTHDSPIKLSYLAYRNWQPNSEHPRYGIFPIIVGTLKTTLVALLIATPISILAALYTAFFAPRRLREILKPTIEILAGFPSVVIGFFCLMTVATIVQNVFGTEFRLNSFVGGIGLALAVIPIIYTITDDALRSVPMSLREAALAIGASEWQAAYQIMLPAATPGIFAAVLLGLGRAFGETMIALMATGNAGTFSWNFFEPVRTFAATIGAEMGEVVFGSPHYQLLFLLGIILFIFSFAINFVTEFYVKQRLIKKFRGVE